MEKHNYTELVERALEEDQDAITELYYSSCDLCYYIARQICNSPEDTLDIIQESYIKAFTNLSSLREPENFKSWLGRIVANQAKNHLRKQNKIKFVNIDLSNEINDDDYMLNNHYMDFQPEKIVDKKQTKEMIEEILNTLPNEQRLVTIMFYFEEMSVKEISQSLDCNENTVKSRLIYARKQIEKSVRNLEKKGTKLYGLLPITFFQLLLHHGAEVYRLPNHVSKKILHNVTHTIFGGNAAGIGMKALASILKPLSSKIIAGIMAGCLIISIPYFISQKNKLPTEIKVDEMITEESDAAQEGLESDSSIGQETSNIGSTQEDTGSDDVNTITNENEAQANPNQDAASYNDQGDNNVNDIAQRIKDYILYGQDPNISSAERIKWSERFLNQVDIDAVYQEYLTTGGTSDDLKSIALYLTENAPVPDNWKDLFEADLYDAYGVKPVRYEYLEGVLYQAYVEIDGTEVPYVVVSARTGWYHG